MGLKEIQSAFSHTKASGRPALMPYWTLGYPDYDTSIRIIEAIVAAGADMLELGVPFSDPLADGPVIQHASQVALEQGITMQGCIDIAHTLRTKGVSLPMFAMGYLNPLLAYGEKKYVEAWHTAGVDGFIIPDLPPEESDSIASMCAAHELALVHFTAPTSTTHRVALTTSRATGFVYVVAVTGVTGARDSLAAGLREYVERVKAQSSGKPVVVGFGISKPEHVRDVGRYADGVIVASALIKAVNQSTDPAQAAFDFVKSLKEIPASAD